MSQPDVPDGAAPDGAAASGAAASGRPRAGWESSRPRSASPAGSTSRRLRVTRWRPAPRPCCTDWARWTARPTWPWPGCRTPALDAPLSRLSHFANHSKPWFLVAGALALFGGRTGRRAALTGVAAIGAASLVVNQPMKLAGDRDRPDRVGHAVPEARWVPMPTSTSFPSGHSASALAFAVAVGDVVPALRRPLRVAGATVAFSRVYTGVHYPGDVLVGAATGAVLGRLVSRVGRRVASR